MYKKIVLVSAVIALSLVVSCDNITEDGTSLAGTFQEQTDTSTSDTSPEQTDASTSDTLPEQTAWKIFNEIFILSGAEFSGSYYDSINGSLITTLLNLAGDNEFWFESPAYNAVLNIGLSGASQESINALLALIHSAILNPWTLLDNTSFNGKHGCVSWSVGNDMNLETLTGLFQNFWTLTVQTSFNDCPDLDGELKTVIYGDRIGIVYSVHVTGDFTVASMPGEIFSIDVLYNLEDCFKTWDCVDWEGTINGYNIVDIY